MGQVNCGPCDRGTGAVVSAEGHLKRSSRREETLKFPRERSESPHVDCYDRFSKDISTIKSAAIFSSVARSSATLHEAGMPSRARALKRFSPDIAALAHSVCNSSTFTPKA